jgi:hypothetical protein
VARPRRARLAGALEPLTPDERVTFITTLRAYEQALSEPHPW